jgi:peroxiredoxin
MYTRSLLLLFTVVFLFQGNETLAQKKKSSTYIQTLSTGNWRGVFTLKPGLEVPFNFEISKDKTEQLQLDFLNAEERFSGGTITQDGDSVFVKLDQFDNELALKVEGDSLTGFLRKQDHSGRPLSLIATKGANYRFKSGGKTPHQNFSGTYDIEFSSPNGKTEKAVGLFKQSGNKITGTFLRITGDSRYLEGIVEGNDFYLSSFIGSTPSYYKGTFATDGSLVGSVVSARGDIPFIGKQNANAALPDANKLTFLKEGYKTLDFSLPDANGKKVSLSDEKYKNKVVILTITGSWCPNCIDEASFLAPWFKENHKRGVEIISLHYERQLDPVYVKKTLNRFREQFGIEYDQVIAGKPDKKIVAESLPALSNFLSFPTTIIINKKGEVAKIHTGYSGPATGKYYTDFVKEFNKEIDELLK